MKYFIATLALAVGIPAGAQGLVTQVPLQDTHITIVDIKPKHRNVMTRQCRQEQVNTDNSTAGTIIGGVAGGIIGNQVGKGTGKDAATVLGAIVGATAGGRIGSDQHNIETREVCTNVPTTVITGEVVTFVYKGRRYSFETHQ